MLIKTVRDLMVALRQGRFTSVGSYPLFFATADGQALDPRTVRENLFQVARAVRDQDNAQWRVTAIDINYENHDLIDAHTGEQIEAAYGDVESARAQIDLPFDDSNPYD